jgi:hypothetical protein
MSTEWSGVFVPLSVSLRLLRGCQVAASRDLTGEFVRRPLSIAAGTAGSQVAAQSVPGEVE